MNIKPLPVLYLSVALISGCSTTPSQLLDLKPVPRITAKSVNKKINEALGRFCTATNKHLPKSICYLGVDGSTDEGSNLHHSQACRFMPGQDHLDFSHGINNLFEPTNAVIKEIDVIISDSKASSEKCLAFRKQITCMPKNGLINEHKITDIPISPTACDQLKEENKKEEIKKEYPVYPGPQILATYQK